MYFAPQRRALFRHLNFQKKSDTGVFCTFWLGNVLRATMACTFSTSKLLKVIRKWCILYILTWLRATTAGFALQRRIFFRHRNFQKWSEPNAFCAFWLQNVLRATTACTFSTSHLPKVVRKWCVLYILTWKCASRHSGVHFFDIATSKSGPKLVCFVYFNLEMCFTLQRRILFRYLNFQKWSENSIFYIF